MVSPSDLVACQLYDREEDVWRDAVRALLWLHPEYRRELAVHRYLNDEISLAKAACLSGLVLEEMKELLTQRGIELRLGPESLDELEQETEVLRRGLHGSSRQ